VLPSRRGVIEVADQKKTWKRTQAKAWLFWLVLFIPIFGLMWMAMSRYGFLEVMPFLIGLLLVTLFYQRFVNKRSWNSILWGIYASKT
jgi:apolipoprotein N-acyltransferase